MADEQKIELVKDFLTCRVCGENAWYIQRLLEEAQAAGKLPEKVKRAVSVTKVTLQNLEKQPKLGDTFDVAYIVRDVCEKCGNEQIIRLEKVEGRAVYNASHLLEGLPFGGQPPGGGFHQGN